MYTDTWEEWLGPEDELVSLLNDDLTKFCDVVVNDKQSWDKVIEDTVNYLKKFTPYDDGEDCYFSPNSAVWQAAYVWQLVELYDSKELSIPPQLSAQLYWFKKGNWPCSYTRNSNGEEIEDYIIL